MLRHVVYTNTIDLRDGYAELADVRLHYVEAGVGPLVVLLHGFPEFWYGWRSDPRASRGRLSRGCTGYARMQPVVTTQARKRLRHRRARSRHPRPDPRARRRECLRSRARLGRSRGVGYGNQSPRGGAEAGHPQRSSPAPLAARLANTAPDVEVVVHLL